MSDTLDDTVNGGQRSAVHSGDRNAVGQDDGGRGQLIVCLLRKFNVGLVMPQRYGERFARQPLDVRQQYEKRLRELQEA